jgi:DNA adenine methylase Dam
MEEIILRHTNKGDVICDPFFGSGTTGIASIKNERFFIGSEIDKKYFEFANEKIHQEHIKNIKNKKVVRSPLYYLGDKHKLLPQIISYFPKKINNFYDVFGGGGTILANIQSKKSYYNDINKNLKEILKFIYSYSYENILKEIKKIIKKFNLTSPTDKKRESKKIKNLNQKKFLELRKKYNNFLDKKSKESLLHLIVLIIYSFNSQIRFNSKGNFNIPVGKQDLNENRIQILKEFTNTIRKKDIKFTSKDFTFLHKIIFKKNDFIYLDPPYLITNATYNSI